MTRDLTIVGGTYLERCIQPLWDAIYGSAGRAAQAARNLVPGQIALHSYVHPASRPDVEHLAADCHATLMASPADHRISFSYLHPMSTPLIRPSPERIVTHPAIH